MFRFDFQPFGRFDLFFTGRSHFLLSERSLSFNNAMITLTSARWSARIVELASGVKWPLKNRQNKDLKDKWSLNERRKYCRMLPCNSFDLHLAIIGLENHIFVFLRVAVLYRILLNLTLCTEP